MIDWLIDWWLTPTFKKKSANVGVKHQSINHKIPRFPQKINQQGNDLTATGKWWKVKFGNKKRVLGVTLYHNMSLFPSVYF